MYTISKGNRLVAQHSDLDKAIALLFSTMGDADGEDTTNATRLIKQALSETGRFQWDKFVIFEEHPCPEGYDEPTCTNPEMHAKFAERGIEDQCGHCKIDPSRL
jgi:hypothetical protein